MLSRSALRGCLGFGPSASFAQYFTGKKNVPDFEEQKATAKKFINAGIDADEFELIMKIAKKWFDNAIENEMGSKGRYGKVVNKKLNLNIAFNSKSDNTVEAIGKWLSPLSNELITEEVMKAIWRSGDPMDGKRFKLNLVNKDSNKDQSPSKI